MFLATCYELCNLLPANQLWYSNVLRVLWTTTELIRAKATPGASKQQQMIFLYKVPSI